MLCKYITDFSFLQSIYDVVMLSLAENLRGGLLQTCNQLKTYNQLIIGYSFTLSKLEESDKENLLDATRAIDRFRYIKIEPNSIDLSTKFWD